MLCFILFDIGVVKYVFDNSTGTAVWKSYNLTSNNIQCQTRAISVIKGRSDKESFVVSCYGTTNALSVARFIKTGSAPGKTFEQYM